MTTMTLPRSVEPDGGLTRRALGGMAWEGLSYLFGRLLVFATTVVLARILAPGAFGVVGLALVFVSAAEVLTNTGFAQAIIYLPSSKRRNDAAMVMLCATAVVMAIAGFVSAPAVAHFFGQGSVTTLVRIASLSLLITAASEVPDNLLRKELKFRRRLGADVSRATARGVASIAFAIAGAGAMSIILGLVIGDLIYGVVVWKLVDYRPWKGGRFLTSWNDLRPLAKYGTPAAAAALVSYLGFNVDYLIVGRMLGASSLGYYVLAFRIPEMAIINVFFVISCVAFPVFARVNDQRERFARGYLNAVRAQSVYGIAAGVGIAVTAPYIVSIIFGPKWAPAATPLAFIGLYAAFRSMSTSAADAYQASGRPGLAAIVSTGRLVLLVPILIVGAHFGISGVAAAQAVSAFAFMVVAQIVATKLLHVRIADVLRAYTPGLACGAGIAAAAWGVRMALAGAGDIVALLATVLAGATAGIACLLCADSSFVPYIRKVVAAR